MIDDKKIEEGSKKFRQDFHMSSKDFKRNFKEWLYIDDLLQRGFL